jgi:hypothetical protein
MAQTKDERHAAVHARAMERFDSIQSAMRDERRQCLEDRRFYSIAGAQWEGALGEQFENKPRLEVNKVHLAVIRIINEYRNNRITVNFTPKPEKEGMSDEDLAETCNGLYRADEQDSGAQEAYDNGYEEGVGGGFGAWRLRAAYEDDEDDEDDRQRIRIEPIFDADTSVFFDLDAKRQDKADAKHCFVLTSMTPAAYRDTYEDDPTTWPKEGEMNSFDWATPDVVFVAEYYEIEEKKELIHVFRGLDDQDMMVPDAELKDDPDKARTLEATGFREVRQKRVTRKRVHKYQLSGGGVLDDEGLIAGSCIPVVPVYGKRWFVDNVERCMGHVRLAKDAQRLKNMQLSKLAEISAYSTIEKPIVTPEQMLNHSTMWSEDNVKNYPYLLLNSHVDAEGNKVPTGPMAYTKVPNIPPAMAALLQITEQDMQDVLGNQQAGEEMQPNMSGKAVELIQNRLDMQVFIYMDNMAKAVKRTGEIWLSMAKDVYVEPGRVMKTIESSGETGHVELVSPTVNADTGQQHDENDLTKAKFDVGVDVGPSSSSKRASTVRALTGMMSITQDPQTLQVLASAAMMNMEGEGLGDIRDFYRRQLVRQGVIKPTEEEKAELAKEAEAAKSQQPDPQSQYLLASAQQAAANASLSQAKTVDAMASAGLKKAQTDKTVAETHGENQAHHIDAAQAIRDAAAPPPNSESL